MTNGTRPPSRPSRPSPRERQRRERQRREALGYPPDGTLAKSVAEMDLLSPVTVTLTRTQVWALLGTLFGQMESTYIANSDDQLRLEILGAATRALNEALPTGERYIQDP